MRIDREGNPKLEPGDVSAINRVIGTLRMLCKVTTSGDSCDGYAASGIDCLEVVLSRYITKPKSNGETGGGESAAENAQAVRDTLDSITVDSRVADNPAVIDAPPKPSRVNQGKES